MTKPYQKKPNPRDYVRQSGGRAVFELYGSPEECLAFSEVFLELRAARSRFPEFNGGHEGWAVIKEELDELWDEVKANNACDHNARNEAKQTAAMAIRYMLDVAKNGKVEV